MTEIQILFAGVPVSDFEVSRPWYERFFGRPADVDVTEGEAMWRIADAAWLYVVSDAGRAGRSVVSLSVGDLEAAVAEIAGRGIEGGPIETVGDAGRKANFTDPDANLLSVIEVAEPD